VKHSALKVCNNEQALGQDGDSELDQSSPLVSDAARYYERRSRIGIKLARGDWWIAIGVYLILIGIGIVVL